MAMLAACAGSKPALARICVAIATAVGHIIAKAYAGWMMNSSLVSI